MWREIGDEFRIRLARLGDAEFRSWFDKLTPGLLKRRSMLFAVEVAKLCRTIRSTSDGRAVASQLFRSATSVAANYRAACRARSLREFVAKMGIVVEECDESLFWLELLARLARASPTELRRIALEADELLAIFVASRGTARRRLEARAAPKSINAAIRQSAF
ncbi:MAG: four helix bundle protein [Gemmatimonadota bacterium]